MPETALQHETHSSPQSAFESPIPELLIIYINPRPPLVPALFHSSSCRPYNTIKPAPHTLIQSTISTSRINHSTTWPLPRSHSLSSTCTRIHPPLVLSNVLGTPRQPTTNPNIKMDHQGSSTNDSRPPKPNTVEVFMTSEAETNMKKHDWVDIVKRATKKDVNQDHVKTDVKKSMTKKESQGDGK